MPFGLGALSASTQRLYLFTGRECEMTCWHRLGERCECGHLSVPARFYADDATQKQAEAAYLGFLKENMPERYEKLAICEEPSEEKPHATKVPSRLRGRR